MKRSLRALLLLLSLIHISALWVIAVASAGYFFGQHWHSLLRAMQRFNIAVLIVALVAILLLWWRHRHPTAPQNSAAK